MDVGIFAYQTEPTMKKAARILLAIASVYALVYIVGAFGHASFDIREWDPVFRGGLALVAGVASFVITAVEVDAIHE